MILQIIFKIEILYILTNINNNIDNFCMAKSVIVELNFPNFLPLKTNVFCLGQLKAHKVLQQPDKLLQ